MRGQTTAEPLEPVEPWRRSHAAGPTRRHCGQRRTRDESSSRRTPTPRTPAVTYTRLDSLACEQSGRFVSTIFVDPSNPNHAWISYSELQFADSDDAWPRVLRDVRPECGHGDVDESRMDRERQRFQTSPRTASFLIPNGDLYVSNDWGVLKRANGSTDWVSAGTGLPHGRGRGSDDRAQCAEALRSHARA